MAKLDVLVRALFIDSLHIGRILAGEKTWEMRTGNSNIRGTIGLIETGTGNVVGVANLVDAKGPLTPDEMLASLDKHRRTVDQLDDPKFSERNYAWVLENARPLRTPVPYGRHGGARIWKRLDADVRAQIRAQMQP